jgi:hypothetical protein
MTEDRAAGPAEAEAEPRPRPRRHRAAPARIIGIAVGVPLLLCAVFVALYLTGAIRDEQRANYCAVYAPVSADLQLFEGFAADLQAGDPRTVIASSMNLRARLDALADLPSTDVIESRLRTMDEFLLEVEIAARAHNEETLAALAARLDSFTADRREFLRQSAEYCRYR